MLFLAAIAEIGFVTLGCLLIIGGFATKAFNGKINGESIFLVILGGVIFYLAVNFGPITASLGV